MILEGMDITLETKALWRLLADYALTQNQTYIAER